MEKTAMEALVKAQREYYATGATLPVEARIAALRALQHAIKRHEKDICDALHADLGKSETESFMCEIGLTLEELSHQLRHVRRYAAAKAVPAPLMHFPSRCMRQAVPHGTVLIMSPWNYPFMLTFEPLVDALAAGNTAIVKPSNYSAATSKLIEQMIRETFPPQLVTCITGGRAENSALLEIPFDFICFTGSPTVGKIVMRSAADNLTPVLLELGGKSPCVVDETADIALSAHRIVFGKFLNCGQTCVAPDHVLCQASVHDALVAAIQKEITRQFGKNPLENKDYGCIINEKHYERIKGLIDPAKVVAGGESDDATRRIAPTVLDNATYDDACMQEEIFGPVLPILTFNTMAEVFEKTESLPHPLAFYLFSNSKAVQQRMLRTCRHGGGCINDVVVHLSTSRMGFGGMGNSGMGEYHGKAGFDAFSHTKSILQKFNWLDVPVRYQPYDTLKNTILHKLLK